MSKSNYHKMRAWGLAIFTLVCAVTLSIPARAVSDGTLDFFALNGIYYYNPTGSNNCTVSSPPGGYTGEPGYGLSATQIGFVERFHDIAEQLSIEFGIPWEAVMAQGILESAAGTSNFAVNRNNFFGLGAYDSNPDHAYYYDTPELGWRGYYEFIRNNSRYRNHGVFNVNSVHGNTVTDPHAYLVAIKEAGYATAEHYVSSVGAIIDKVAAMAADRGWMSSAELAVAYPEMLEHAAANAAGGGSGEPGGGTSGTPGTCATQGNGSINATAIELSWPDRTHSPDDPTPAYREALGIVGLSTYGEACVNIGKSCDAFVATVLRYSGVDPDVVCCGAANMLSYFENHPEKYQEIENIGNTSNMMPGDIRSKPSHVEIIVQLDDGTWRNASASHCDRTADHGGGFYADSEYKIFRKI